VSAVVSNAIVFVIAPNLRQAQFWARREGLTPGEWRYVHSQQQLLGMPECTIVVVNGHRLPSPAPWEAELRFLEASEVTIRQVTT
jgi:hypothetical protein